MGQRRNQASCCDNQLGAWSPWFCANHVFTSEIFAGLMTSLLQVYIAWPPFTDEKTRAQSNALSYPGSRGPDGKPDFPT